MMAYIPLSTPDNLPPNVRMIIEQTDKYLRDVHVMLGARLPGEVKEQLQRAIGLMLFAVISGVSATLYAKEGESGEQFVGLLVDHYPWLGCPPQGVEPEGAASILYQEFRNPMAHALGLGLAGRKTPKIGLVFGKTEAGMEELAQQGNGPNQPPVVCRDDAITIWAGSLYWGIRRMVERMISDPQIVEQAEAFMVAGKFLPPRKRQGRVK